MRIITSIHSSKDNALTWSSAFSSGKGDEHPIVLSQYRDEFFALACGDRSHPHANTAATLSAETALWGYKQIRLRNFYWQDKKKFVSRIFRSTNITLWQKKRETSYQGGVPASLIICIVGPQYIWIGNIGRTCAYVKNTTSLIQLTKQKKQTAQLGVDRYGLIPNFVNYVFDHGMITLLVSGIPDIDPNVRDDIVKECVQFETGGRDFSKTTSAIRGMLSDVHACDIGLCMLYRNLRG